MGEEVLEVELELGDGSKEQLKIQEVDEMDWHEIEKGKKAFMILVDGQQILVIIVSANYEGVSFSLIGNEKKVYHHEERVIDTLFVEV